MHTKLNTWWRANRVILENTGSLVGATVVTSGLGFVFWWAAARLYPPEAVGLASAAVSAMSLLAAVAAFGFTTLLVTELPRRPGEAGPLISTALWAAGLIGAVLAAGFALVAPSLSANYRAFWGPPAITAVFVVGVTAMTAAGVLDNAMIGLLRGALQLHRNTVFAVAKLVLLVLAGLLIATGGGGLIFGVWVVGILLSMVTLAGAIVAAGDSILYRPRWRLLRSLGRSAISHHGLNMSVQAPTLIMPLLVTAMLSASLNASFYAAWMFVGFAFMVPSHLARVLLAVGAGRTHELSARLRLTLGLSAAFAVVSVLVFVAGAHPLLGLFGASYAQHGAGALRVLALAIFPSILRSHYLTIARIRDRMGRATLLLAAAGLVELALATLGARMDGLVGLSAGVTATFFLEGIVTGPIVLRASRG